MLKYFPSPLYLSRIGQRGGSTSPCPYPSDIWQNSGVPARRFTLGRKFTHRMTGIVGIVSQDPVNQQIYDSLLLLQHRGQDATGMATDDGSRFHMFRARGQVREAYRTRDMRTLLGNSGVGHVRGFTAGEAASEEETQPYYVNAPYGLIMVHNGYLTNTRELSAEMYSIDRRHLNTSADTEVLLNVLANELEDSVSGLGLELTDDQVFDAIARLHERVEGSYAAITLISGQGLVAFRDPFGIRPLVLGRRVGEGGAPDWVVASESLVLEAAGYELVRDVEPGEAILISPDGQMTSRQCAKNPVLVPCSFEYIYLARPDSVLSGIPVYDSRLRLGDVLATEIERSIPTGDIDVVMPIPDSARPSAMQVAQRLGVPYREGFFKNRYVGRTFIMPGQSVRRKGVRQKLNAMGIEFQGKNVLIVDDSIVRGTTSLQIVEMARQAGATSVTFASAAPQVTHPHVYGINMPSRNELIASGRSNDEIARMIGADQLIYQTVEGMNRAILDGQNRVSALENSCFTGEYIAGNVTEEYLAWVEANLDS